MASLGKYNRGLSRAAGQSRADRRSSHGGTVPARGPSSARVPSPPEPQNVGIGQGVLFGCISMAAWLRGFK